MHEVRKYYNVEDEAMYTLNEMDEEERKVFDAKLLHAVHNDSSAALYAIEIVRGAEVKGVYDRVKFGAETYPEVIGVTPPLS